MYHPNFCTECGVKILRLRWHIWHSRRFCDQCAKHFRKPRLMLPAISAAVWLGTGLLVGRALRPAPPPLIIERRADSPLNHAPQTGSTTDKSATVPITQQTLSEEVVYICGARTKKGTPCSRRVHAPVRCWQHKGLPAMLSPDKLVVKESPPK